jgi:hypothetical protein
MTDDNPQSASVPNPSSEHEANAAQFPSSPYRGIDAYRFVDHPIFFVRQTQTLELLRSVVIFKGVILFGSSGAGKSSLLNAGLLPKVIEMGFAPDRIKIQNRSGAEIIIERISLNDDGKAPFLAPSLAETVDKNGSASVILSLEDFKERLRTYAIEKQPLLILDQFEETITLFEEIPHSQGSLKQALALQQKIIHALVDLLHDDSLRIKILFTFREDYLAKLTKLFLLAPELPNQFLRLTLPQKQSLDDIIAGPLTEELLKHYKRHQIFPRTLIDRIIEEFTLRGEGDDINLTELQIVCVELWETSDPVALFEAKGVQGLLEDYFAKELDEFPEEQRRIATGLLGHMLTVSNTRNFISGVELIRLFKLEEPTSTTEDLEKALRALTPTRLVRREFRHRNYFYEIASEFLVPWIIKQKIERQRDLERSRLEAETKQERDEERARTKRKLKYLYLGFAVVGLILVLVLWLGSRERKLKNEADEAKNAALRESQEKGDIIETLRGMFESPSTSASLDERKRAEITKMLKTDKLAGIRYIDSLLDQKQIPVDEVPKLTNPLTRDSDPEVAKTAQNLVAKTEKVKAQQKVLNETAKQDKLKAIEGMRGLMKEGLFPPSLVLSLLGPTLTDKNLDPSIVNATRDLFREASAMNPEVRVSIADAVNNDPSIANIVPRVYIQIESEQRRDQANRIKAELESKGYLVPAFEIVGIRAPHDNQLRFYREADREYGLQIIEMLKALSLEVQPKYLEGYENSTKLRPGHYELWLATQSKPGEDRYLVVRYYSAATEEQRAAVRNQISQIIEQEGGTMEDVTAREFRIGPYSKELAKTVHQRLIDFDPHLIIHILPAPR